MAGAKARSGGSDAGAFIAPERTAVPRRDRAAAWGRTPRRERSKRDRAGVSALARLAARGPAPVFAAIGPGARTAVEDLSLAPALAFVASPREAEILLVAGEPRDEDREALRRLHDQLPHPRATLWWGGRPDPAFGSAVAVAPGDDPAARLVETRRALLSGAWPSEPDLLPDEPPAPWRGVGPHGQGGEGMMGGKPYGRPMPMMGEEARDGLMLDAYTARFGPFLPMSPPGLVLELTLQGDVIQSAATRRPPSPQAGLSRPGEALRAAARMLDLLGLAAQAERLRRAAATGRGVGRAIRFARFSGALRALPPGLAELPPGPAREAVGADARERLRRWLSLAEDGTPPPAVPSRPDWRLADLLIGLEWSAAMLAINSFEPDLLAAMSPVDPEQEEEGDDDDHEAETAS